MNLKLFIISTILTNILNLSLCSNEGALLSVQFSGKVGFNLDEIPLYSLRDIEKYILNEIDDEMWIDRARRQIFFTLASQSVEVMPNKQLTLPPVQVWKISMTTPATWIHINNHSYIMRTFDFNSVVFGKASSLEDSDHILTETGDRVLQTFLVPLDPESVFQKIGLACGGSESINSENAYEFFDSIIYPNCAAVLEANVGSTNLEILWERIEWNGETANSFRYGSDMSEAADLQPYLSDLVDDVNIGYRYIDENSCTLNEGGVGLNRGCVGGVGWRQLLRFSSTAINVGKTPLNIGDVRSNEYIKKGMVEFDPCHQHYHFQHYANFSFGDKLARKTGFCFLNSWRYLNNEFTGFNSPYYNCSYQGISTGWGDKYGQGLICQWIDVTSMKPSDYMLKVLINPDDFVCEGASILKETGELEWIKTSFISSISQSSYRGACNFTSNYRENNIAETLIKFAGNNSIVTLPCKREGIFSPTKDCGFEVQFDNLVCNQSKENSITIKNSGGDHAIIRLCETSRVLGHSIACEYVNRLANIQIEAGKFKVF
jgi:hypothetical protein